MLISSGYNEEAYLKIINFVKTLNADKISLSMFLDIVNNNTAWSINSTLNLFNTIDEQGKEILEVRYLIICLSILLPLSLRDKFIYLTEFLKENIIAQEFLLIVHDVELFLDPFSRIYSLENESLNEDLKLLIKNEINLSSFPEIIVSNSIFAPLCKLIEYIDTNDEVIHELRMAEISLDGHYSNIHSPIRSNSINTTNLEEVEFKKIESKLNLLSEADSQKSNSLNTCDLDFQVINDEDSGSEYNISTKFSDPIQTANPEIKRQADLTYLNNLKVNMRSCSRLCEAKSCILY